MRIKIYDKTNTQLTTLITSSSTSDFNGLSYKGQVNGNGDAGFTVRLDNAKITDATMEHYNRVEITDDDGTVRWVGLIVEKQIALNLMTVKCYGLMHILDKRITGANVTYSGAANTKAAEVLSTANGVAATGITAGTMDVTTAVNITVNRGKVLQVIKSIADSVGAQIMVKSNKKLYLQEIVGQDLSASVVFRYEIDRPELANVLGFKVDDNGREIISKTYGESGALTSAQQDAAVYADYGLHEAYVNFRELNDQITLDNSTANNNQGSDLMPDIDLSPDVADNFEAGDVVRIILKNKLVNIDASYQIYEKSVKIVNSQKLISVKLNAETKGFYDDLKKLRENVELLNRAV